jgi:hypothetical protein
LKDPCELSRTWLLACIQRRIPGRIGRLHRRSMHVRACRLPRDRHLSQRRCAKRCVRILKLRLRGRLHRPLKHSSRACRNFCRSTLWIRAFAVGTCGVILVFHRVPGRNFHSSFSR